jgi:peptidoglycan/LPS O-acetylase OafA/YrhL
MQSVSLANESKEATGKPEEMHQTIKSVGTISSVTVPPAALQPRIAYLPYFDGLRAVAVLLVLWVHFPYIQNSALSKSIWKAGQFVRGGYIGVDLFFVLSGFLITRILLQEQARNGLINYNLFFRKRILRIFPIYYLCILVATLYFGNNSGSLVSLFTFTYNYYHPLHPAPNPLEHTWSLSVEEQFYIIWPFLATRIPGNWSVTVTGYVIPAAAVATALLFAGSLDSTLAASFIYMSGPTQMMSLSLGASLAFVERSARHPKDFNTVLCFGLGVALLAAGQLAKHFGLIAHGGYAGCIAIVGYALICASTVSLLVFSRNAGIEALRSLLSFLPLRYLGQISYGLYLYHYLVLYLMDIPPSKVEGTGTDFGRAFLALAASLAVASLSFHYLERPLLSLRYRNSELRGRLAASS